MKPTTAEKTAKPATKSGPKVFDVAHPGKGTPSATSRPVIVTNRPILQDPMVSNSGESVPGAPKLSPAAVKVTIKPLSDTDEADKSEKPAKDEKDKTIAELAAEKSVEKLAEAAIKDKEKPERHETDTKEEEASSDDKDEASDEKSEEPESDSSAAAPENDDKDKPAEAKTDAEELPVEDTKEAKETAELEAEAKKLEAINALVESRQYVLPINAVERHRSKVVSLFGLVLIVVLGLLLIDLMLDVGFIHIKGVHSLTHFFSAPV